MSKPTMNLDELEFSRDLGHGQGFEARFALVSERIGARKLGYNVTVVPPGKRAFPFHNHHANEELFFILEGEGMLRFGSEEHPVRKGDFIACPPGGPDVAHQIINTGSSEMRYIAVSTTLDTDVYQYPDSGKFGVAAGRVPGMPREEIPFHGFYAEDARLGYWDGEEP